MDEYFEKCQKNMALVVKEKNLGEWLKNFEPDTGKGFMFTIHQNIDIISQGVAGDGHSGCSFAMCIRAVQKELKEVV